MEHKGKDSKRGKQHLRPHARNPQYAAVEKPTATLLLPPEPIYAWREKDDPPGQVRTGTAHELNERARGGATIIHANPTGDFRPGGTVVTGRAGKSSEVEVARVLGQAVELMVRDAAEAVGQQPTIQPARVWLRRLWAKEGCLATAAPIPSGKPSSDHPRCWREAGDQPGTVRTGSERLLRARRRAGVVVEEISQGSLGPDPGRAAAAAAGTESVPMPADLLKAARERTGIEDPAELVAFALSLVAEQGAGEEAFNAALGSLPGHTLETF